MLPHFPKRFGNRQSVVYDLGREAFEAVEKARGRVSSGFAPKSAANVPAIVGMGKAAEVALAGLTETGIVKDLGSEPDHDSALAAARGLL